MSSAYPYHRLSKEDAAVLFMDHQCGLTALALAQAPSKLNNSVMTLSDLDAGYPIFVTGASGTFNKANRELIWLRMVSAGIQLLDWFAVVFEPQRDRRNGIQGFSKLLCGYTPIYQNLMASYAANSRA
ncbi:MAG: hypothetical protein ACXV9R_08255 [Methylobacter sp.]